MFGAVRLLTRHEWVWTDLHTVFPQHFLCGSLWQQGATCAWGREHCWSGVKLWRGWDVSSRSAYAWGRGHCWLRIRLCRRHLGMVTQAALWVPGTADQRPRTTLRGNEGSVSLRGPLLAVLIVLPIGLHRMLFVFGHLFLGVFLDLHLQLREWDGTGCYWHCCRLDYLLRW